MSAIPLRHPAPRGIAAPRTGPSSRALLGRFRLSLVLLAALLLGPGTALAQLGFQTQPDIPENLAQFTVRLQPQTARPGEFVRLEIEARLAEGWYTYSTVPQGELAPPPTTLELDESPLRPDGPVYETNPVVKEDKLFDLTLAFHPNAARFYQNFAVPADLQTGTTTVSGRLRYQVCNSTYCTPARYEAITAALTVEPGPPRAPYGFPDRTVAYVDADGNFHSSADTLEAALAQGVGSFLLLAMGFGLLALLTPCVFPMIPVTVSFFTSARERAMAEGKSARAASGLGLATLFGVGIVVTYAGLGMLLTFFLGASGVNRFASNPWVNLAVASFFVFFALSLMGLFELKLPDGLVQRLNRSALDPKGPLGVIVMGVAFTATSFTCTAPFVGTLLVAATQGQVFWPVLGMLVFATVFAVPFFLLALFPGVVGRLRGRSGPWLTHLKVGLGLLELAAALKFLSNADLIWQWGVLTRDVMLAAWLLLALLVAAVVLGAVRWPGERRVRPVPPRLAIGLAFVVAAAYLGLGLTGRDLDAYTESYLPPPLYSAAATASGGDANLRSMDDVHGLPWHDTLEAGLAEAQATGKPIFIDFTGYTCINCRWMEKKIFAAQPVFNRFRDEFVLVQLYTDGGEHAADNQNLQIERFQTVALPYYVILAPDNTVLARHGGLVPDPLDFLRFLDQGRRVVAPATHATPAEQTAKTGAG